MAQPILAKMRSNGHLNIWDASKVEILARYIAIGRGLLDARGHLCQLEIAVQHELRCIARAALVEERTIHDAECWARDEHAKQEYGKTFNCLTPQEQRAVYRQVHNVLQSVWLYLTGVVEPMSEWQRKQVQIGARPSLYVVPQTDKVQ